MEARLFTVHRKGERGIEVIDDRFDFFALILPPIWAIWNGLWVTLVALILLPVAAGLYHPVAITPVLYGMGIIVATEGGAIKRWEMRLRGWREVGVVEARSEDGAEEQYITGHAV